MIITDLGYGNGLWLDAPAAASLWRVNAQIGRRLDINEAGRTWEQQNKFRMAYLNGTGAFALPAGTSIHEQGRAVDTDDRFIEIMADHGWFRTALARNEPWHFEYDESRDNHRGAPASGGAVDFPQSEEDEMATLDELRGVVAGELKNWVGYPDAGYSRVQVIDERIQDIQGRIRGPQEQPYDQIQAILGAVSALTAEVRELSEIVGSLPKA